MSAEAATLPRELGDGLIMRWATPADAEPLAEFNVRIHSDNSNDPEEGLRVWTLDLMRGDHPTTAAGDFIVVVNREGGGKIVSSLNLISQTWSYETVPFGVGRVELVGTDPDYRRRGLIRAQMEAIHAHSAARGELAQVITGIPWYYRMFGYEMALALGGSRFFPRERLPQAAAPEEEPYAIREATVADIPLLGELYARHCATSMVNRLRSEEVWRYELIGPHEKSFYRRRFRIVEKAGSAKPVNSGEPVGSGESVRSGEPVAYFEWQRWPVALALREIGVAPGRSLRAIGLRIARWLGEKAREEEEDAEPGKEGEQKPLGLLFALGPSHPAYEALPELAESSLPYGWYVRVPDVPAFLRTIRPVLEARLAESVVAGHSGRLRLNLFSDRIALQFAGGRLQEIGSYEAKRLEEGDATFPGLTFLQLLFCFRSLADIRHAFPDCYASREATVLLNALFPPRVSQPVGMG